MREESAVATETIFCCDICRRKVQVEGDSRPESWELIHISSKTIGALKILACDLCLSPSVSVSGYRARLDVRRILRSILSSLGLAGKSREPID